MLCTTILRQLRSPRLPSCLSRLAVILFALLAGASLPAQVASPVSGFYTFQIWGSDVPSTPALSFVGLGLTRPVVYRGRLDNFGSGMVTDSHAQWSDGQFEGANGPHYIELTSGQYAGLTADIATCSGTTRTLALSVDLSPLLSGGEAYCIRPCWTLASVFGPNDEAGLGGGSSVTADEILVLDTCTGVYSSYYYKTAGLGGTGWRSTTSPFTDQSNARISLGQGILVQRKQPGDISLKLFGTVKAGNTLLPVAPGLNIVANIAPTGMMLGNSGLYTGDSGTGLAGGSLTSADQVLLFDGVTYQTYYYKTTGLGGTGWRSASGSSLDASDTIIPPGGAVLIQRATSRPGFYWKVPISQ
jgi:uncharacterized protein (TIGR02597 family)